MKLTHNSKAIIIYSFFLVGFIINFLLSVKVLGTLDVNAWVRSAGLSNKFGLLNSYKIYSAYYPPMFSVLLWPAGKIYNIQPSALWINDYPSIQESSKYFPTIKIEILIFLYLLIGGVIFFLVKAKRFSLPKSVLFSAVIFANPAFIWSASLLGYIDIFFALPLLFAYIFLEKKRYFLSGITLALSFSIKLLPLLLVPLFIVYFLRVSVRSLKIKIDYLGLVHFILGVTVVVLPIIKIYSYESIRNIFDSSLAHGAGLSNNATNLNWIIRKLILHTNSSPGWWISFTKAIFYVSMVVYALKIAFDKKKTEITYVASIGILFTYYIFVTGAHENHFFPGLIIALGLLLYKPGRRSWIIFLIVSFINFANLFVFYFTGIQITNGVYGGLIPVTRQTIFPVTTSFLSILGFVYFIYLIFKDHSISTSH